MQFIVTHLDKELLLQALYVHADPKGMGKAVAYVRELYGDNVHGLTSEESREILRSQNQNGQVADYVKGRPIKLGFRTDRYGQILASSYAYDIRNGKYRFLEVLLNTFLEDEILIKRKAYPSELASNFEKERIRSINEMAFFHTELKELEKVKDEKGTYWKIKQ